MSGSRPVIGFDTETTGTDVESARIVAAAMVWRDGDGATVRERSWLVDPGVPIPPAASAVHGITDASGGREPTGALEEIAWELTRGWAVVAFNAQFDMTVLGSELRRHGLEPLADRYGHLWPVLDPFVIDWGLWPERPGRRTLEALCGRYGCPPRAWHDAAEDAHAAVDLWEALCVAAPELAECPMAQMAEFQRIAHQSWVEHVNAGRLERGLEPAAIPGWPLAAARCGTV